jgi:hypothetical protein
MDPVESIMVIANLAAGFGCAIPLARLLGKLNASPKKALRYFVMLIGIYFIESVALAAGMASQVFSVGMAFVWGILFGLWLRSRAPAPRVLKTSLFLSLYTCLPTVSLLLIPLLMGIGGDNILSAEQGARFGIPTALRVPWPLNTILGFFGAIVIATLMLKPVITTGIVSILIQLREKPAAT